MPRIKKVEVVETKVEEVTPEVVEVEVEKVVKPEPDPSADVVYPEVHGNGKFQHVKFSNGYVVYNPNGQRATGKVDLRTADDIVLRQNVAMGL